jgi:hypothetical protein
VTPDIPVAVRFPSTTLTWSRCYTATNGALSCVTCHDPHRDASTAPADYEAKCLSCHSNRPASPAASAETPRSPACPVNPANGCVECHMPKTQAGIPHTTFTDHNIRVHDRRSGSN